jgi:ecotin
MELEPRANEEDFKVELILGKTVETDGVNRHFFGGKIERHTVEGWGYTYHKLDKLGPMAGTRMAPLPGKEKVKAFVRIGGEPYWVRYNSKLPVVVYAPEGVEVRYRLWSAKGAGELIPEA